MVANGCKMRQNVIQSEWAQHTRRARKWDRIVWHWGLRGIRQEIFMVGSKGTMSPYPVLRSCKLSATRL